MSTRDKKVLALLKKHDVKFNILDLGASGEGYRPFKRVREVANMYLVDPDDRDFNVNNPGSNSVMINKAVIESDIDDEVKLFLAASPHCSSTLKPDFSKLNNFTYPDLFEVIDSCMLPATSLNRISEQYNLESIDWIKLDTQGTELRILKSMNSELLSKMLCVDIEISLYAHYLGADTFPELHKFLEGENFWISDFEYQSRIRMRKSDYDGLMNRYSNKFSRLLVKFTLPTCPTSPEIRYVRSLNTIDATTDYRYCLKLWALNYFLGNDSYSYYLANIIDEHFNTEDSRQMLKISTASINSISRIVKGAIKFVITRILYRAGL